MKNIKQLVVVALVSLSVLFVCMNKQSVAGDFPGYKNPGIRYMGMSMTNPGVVQRFQIPVSEEEPRWANKLNTYLASNERALQEFLIRAQKSEWSVVAQQLWNEIASVDSTIQHIEKYGGLDGASPDISTETLHFLKYNDAYGMPGLIKKFKLLNELHNVSPEDALKYLEQMRAESQKEESVEESQPQADVEPSEAE